MADLLCSVHSVWLTNWLTFRLFAVHTVELTDQLTDWLAFCVTYTLSDWLTCWLAVFPTCLHAGWLPVSLFTWQILRFKLFTQFNTFQSKRSCVSGQYQTAEQSDQIRFTVVRGKNPYFYCLSSVSLSIFSLQTSRPLFDCSRIFENAKIWTVLQSRPVFGQNEPKLPKDLLSLKPATKKCMLFADLHQDLHNHFCPFR